MKIITRNETILVKDYGLRALDYDIPSPSLTHTTEKMDGTDGEKRTESYYNPRPIKVPMRLRTNDSKGMPRLKRKFNQLFAQREEFFVVFDKEPWRRWKVQLNSPVEWDNVSVYFSQAEIDLICHSGFAESIGTTLSMPLTDDGYYYSIGEGKIDEGDPVIQYTFDQASFSLFNDSDIFLEPENKEMRIILKGQLNNPIIRNLTTGDEWSWAGTATAADEIVLNGIRSLKNDVSVFGQTNKKVIRLAPGWNDFEIVGASAFTVSFDLRFYYF